MTRHFVAFGLMAVLVVAGIVIGLYLRGNSRERILLRDRARHRARRTADAEAAAEAVGGPSAT